MTTPADLNLAPISGKVLSVCSAKPCAVGEVYDRITDRGHEVKRGSIHNSLKRLAQRGFLLKHAPDPHIRYALSGPAPSRYSLTKLGEEALERHFERHGAEVARE